MNNKYLLDIYFPSTLKLPEEEKTEFPYTIHISLFRRMHFEEFLFCNNMVFKCNFIILI